MSPLKTVAVALTIAGGPGLSYGNLHATKALQQTPPDPIAQMVRDRSAARLPAWDGLAALAAGLVLLLVSESRSAPRVRRPSHSVR